MVYTRDKLERVVLCIILNDDGCYGFMKSCRMSLRKELFKNRQNAFIYGIINDMYAKGISDMTPISIYEYANENNIRYGNAGNFASYMCELMMETHDFDNFKKYVKSLVSIYLKDKKIYGTT